MSGENSRARPQNYWGKQAGEQAAYERVTLEHKQIPRSPRRNGLPVKCINRSLLMCHEYLTGTLVELKEIMKTASGSNGVLHHAPEAFDGVEVVPTMDR